MDADACYGIISLRTSSTAMVYLLLVTLNLQVLGILILHT
jgi:hypothetical protein